MGKNALADWKRDVKISLALGQRTAVAWLLESFPGVNRSDARMIASLFEALDLTHALEYTLKTGWKVGEFTLSRLQLEYLKDEFGKKFDASQIPPKLAVMALLLLDDIVAVLEGKEQQTPTYAAHQIELIEPKPKAEEKPDELA